VLTMFSTPKPFYGHSAVIQRNALESWSRLHADVQVILFGDEEGTPEICRELGLGHEPEVQRSEFGTKRLDWMFGRAQQLARYDFVCYVNCDIVLTREFRLAFETLRAWRTHFLMVGRRWDTKITEPLDFAQPDWEERVIARAHTEGIQRFYNCVDFFLFPKGLYAEMPALVIGRNGWDHWLVWKARKSGAAIVDASDVVTCIHQDHDYGYHPKGMIGVGQDEEALRNNRLLGGRRHQRTIEDAEFRLTHKGVRPARFYWLAPVKRRVRRTTSKVRAFVRTSLWYPFLDQTRPLRQYLGLRQTAFSGTGKRKRSRRSGLDDGY
jgi:hypothetical protein